MKMFENRSVRIGTVTAVGLAIATAGYWKYNADIVGVQASNETVRSAVAPTVGNAAINHFILDPEFLRPQQGTFSFNVASNSQSGRSERCRGQYNNGNIKSLRCEYDKLAPATIPAH